MPTNQQQSVNQKIRETKWKALNKQGITAPVTKEDNDLLARQAHIKVDE